MGAGNIDDAASASNLTDPFLLLGESVSSCDKNREDGKDVYVTVTSEAILDFRQRFDVVEARKDVNSLFRCFCRILVHYRLIPGNQSYSVMSMRSLLATHFRSNHEKLKKIGGFSFGWNCDSYCNDITNGSEPGKNLMISTFVDLFPVEVCVYTSGQNEDEPDFHLCTFRTAAGTQQVKHRATLLREIEYYTDDENSNSECCGNLNFHWVRDRNPTDSAFISIHDPLPRGTLFSSVHNDMQDHIKILPGADGKTCDAQW